VKGFFQVHPSEMLSIQQSLAPLLRGDELSLQLDEAASYIAQIEFPTLHHQEVASGLDLIAEHIRPNLKKGFRNAADEFFFGKLGFAGNEDDYYNPWNSCLNWVLESKRGIPITLSLAYMEVGRRLGVRVDGISAPGHFLIRLEEDGDEYYLDPFRGGIIRDDIEEDLAQSGEASYRIPATRRGIVVRMLNNLRHIYLERRSWSKVEAVLDCLLTADPQEASYLRERSAARTALHRYRLAAQDLDLFLTLNPTVPDADELRAHSKRLLRMHSAQN
jgi:regulator of sirC expression with transglutaminase-like and TPR domain